MEISSLSFTGEFFVLVLSGGDFLAGFEKRFFLDFHEEKIKLRVSGLEPTFEGIQIGKWAKCLVQVRMLELVKASLLLKFGTVQYRTEVNWAMEAWQRNEIRIGDKDGHGSGFVGFLYRAKLYNQIFEEDG